MPGEKIETPITLKEILDFLLVNDMDEIEAVSGYQKFLSKLEETITSKQENKDIIEFIRNTAIPQELNHSRILRQLYEARVGITPSEV